MKLSPLDIRKQEFKRTLRGLDAEEVQSFLQMVSSQWDELQAEQRRLEQRVNEQEGKLQHYVKVEEALQEALRTARESSRQAIDSAKQQAEGIVRDAERQAAEILRSAEQDRKALRREASEVRSRRNEIVARLRSFLHSEMEMLSRYEADHPLHTDPSDTRSSLQQRPAAAPVRKEEPQPPSSTATGEDAPEKPESEASYDEAQTPSSEPAPREEARAGNGWKLNRLITAPAGAPDAVEDQVEIEGEGTPENANTLNVAATTDEIERIRRILKDLE